MTTTAPPRVRIDGLTMTYRPKKRAEVLALDGVDVSIAANSFVSVIGPSGCGKSTLLKVISKVVGFTDGRVEIDGVPIAQADLTGRLSFMFQQPLLLPWRTVLDNVLLPVQILRRRVRPEDRDRALRLLDLVGLGSSLQMLPHQLSGGMKQRVALARALVTEPEILLMDEPFGAVDEITRETLQVELLRIWQETRTTIVLVTHHVEEAVLLSDRVIVMSARPGRVVVDQEIDLPRPRDESVRETEAFHGLVDRLRAQLRPDTREAQQ